MVSTSNRWWVILAILAVVAAIMLRLLLIDMPFDRDEGGYAYIGEQWFQGNWPYLHAVESKPPGVFAAYAVILAIHRSVTAVRWALVLVGLVNSFLLYFLARRYVETPVACWAVALLSLTQISPAYDGQSANAEMFMVPLIVAALLAISVSIDHKPSWLDFLGGLLFGAAILFKPVAATEILPALAIVSLTESSTRSKILRLLLLACGLFVVLSLCYFLFALAGAGRDMLFWSFSYNLSYGMALPLSQRWSRLVFRMIDQGIFLHHWPLWVASIIGIFALMKQWQKGRTRATFLILWMVSAFIGVSGSGYYYRHYFQQLLPPMCLVAAFAVWFLVDRIQILGSKTKALRRLVFSGGLLTLLLIWPFLLEARLYSAGPSLARVLYGSNPFMEGEEVGNYLALNTSPEEKVLIFGSEGQFLFHARRLSAWKYVFAYPLAGYYSKTLELQKEAFAEVVKSQPRYIVLVMLPSSMVLNKNAPRYLFSRMHSFLIERYQLEASLVAVTQNDTQLLTSNLSQGKWPEILAIFRRKD